ncbi:putative aldouronate transport system substrate-binding protein [Paenibacillus phyllosphaerae]|uniref:Putative aldouronate transport system substrate-binding protein n=1 Tax=Paenibacillus phyllosphaerae TaxID=274593 RepID=A0A7W5AVJ0_9BACL|nr:ABC transporter substrate-binding protein [Paenibacillus phyllosphaerae]MBB3109550.1 putative aldouronate transport system substrate-binding protein [Paenibacillus phyllosphaerae]
MTRKRKWSGVVLTTAMVAGLLAGCGGNDNNAGTNNGGNASNSGANGNATADTTPLTMSYYSEDPNPNWAGMQDEVGKQITSKTGITLEAEFAVGDPVQKSALIATSGDYPDLIAAKNSINKFVDAGAVIDLTDLIEEHAPNIKKLYGDQMARLRYSNEDKSIYVIPTNAGVNQTYFNAGGGFELQHRVVKELGYPTIRTVKDFENAIKQYLAKYPTDENGNPNIGLTLNADDWHMYISVTNPAFLTTGAPDDGEYYIDPKTYEVTYHFKRPEEKEYFRWLNHMNAEGLLDKESFVQKYDQYKAKVASGRVLGLIDQDWDYGDGEKALKAEGKFEYGYGHYPVTLSEEFKETSFWPTGFMSGYGIAISSTNPDPVRAIKFLDYLASEEGQVLVNWGVEGKHYNVEDTKRVIPADVNNRKVNDAANFQKESGIGNYTMIGPHYGDGVKDSTGNYFTTNFPEQIVAGFNDVEKEVLAAYKATTWKDLFPKEDEFEVKPWGAAWNIPVPGDSEITILDEKLKTITWKRIPEAILATPENFDKVWDDYMKELDAANVEKAEELRGELVKARVELWSGE